MRPDDAPVPVGHWEDGKALDDGLARRPANHVALTPTRFLERAAVIHGERACTYAAFYERADG